MPVLVWVDGSEPPGPVLVPTRAEVASYLLPWVRRRHPRPCARRDPAAPSVLERVVALGTEYASTFGRPGAVAVSAYGEGAAIVVVVPGAVHGTVQDVVDDLRREGRPVGAVGITVSRPFPADQLRMAVEAARVVLVLDRTPAIGADVEVAVRHTDVRDCRVVTGRIGEPLGHRTVEALVRAADAACPPPAYADGAAFGHVQRKDIDMTSERAECPAGRRACRGEVRDDQTGACVDFVTASASHDSLRAGVA